jgi:hypothetical protein
MLRKVAALLFAPVLALTIGTGVAQASPRTTLTSASELCSAPAVFGSYALRACIEFDAAGWVHGYAYVSLDAGHSPCTVRRRYATSGGGLEPLYTTPCPSGAVPHWRVDTPDSICCGTFHMDASIQRTTDGNIAPKAHSPSLTD